MGNFDDLSKEIEMGMNGRNNGIPIGFDRLNSHIGIRKSIYFLVGGLTGSGKTSLVDDAFVLNPVDWYLANRAKTNIRLKVVYRSMERNRVYKFAKWLGRKIFLDTGIIIPVPKLLGWNKGQRLTFDEHDLALSYKDYFGEISEVVTVIDGAENAVGIAKELKGFALERGRIEQLDQYNKVYIPNDENEIVLVVIDHLGKLKLTKDQTTKKAAIDKMSDELAYARDFFGYSPIAVNQFNREISNPARIKAGDVEPQLEDFKESGQTQDDADVVMALFDPMRYRVQDPSGYNLDKLKDEQGVKYFRSLRVIKNSYGADDIRIGMGFLGPIGLFKELPKKKDMTDEIYQSVTNKSFFLPS